MARSAAERWARRCAVPAAKPDLAPATTRCGTTEAGPAPVARARARAALPEARPAAPSPPRGARRPRVRIRVADGGSPAKRGRSVCARSWCGARPWPGRGFADDHRLLVDQGAAHRLRDELVRGALLSAAYLRQPRDGRGSGRRTRPAAADGAQAVALHAAADVARDRRRPVAVAGLWRRRRLDARQAGDRRVAARLPPCVRAFAQALRGRSQPSLASVRSG